MESQSEESTRISGSGSGQISHLLSGTIWFCPDTKNAVRCIPSRKSINRVIKWQA